jgi:hypothetical protein
MAVAFTDIQERDLQFRERLIRRILEELEAGSYQSADLAAHINGAAAATASVARAGKDFGRIFDLENLADPVLRDLEERLDVRQPNQSRLRWTEFPFRLDAAGDLARNPAAHLVPRSHFDARLRPIARKVDLNGSELKFVVVAGILERDRAFDRVDVSALERNGSSPMKYAQDIELAVGEFKFREEMYKKALPRLVREGEAGSVDKVRTVDWAGIVDSLAKENITDSSLYFEYLVSKSLDGRTGAPGPPGSPHYGGPSGKPSWINISLPDLESAADLDIVEDNLMAMQVIYFASTLEDVRFFQVMDKILELFNMGVLPFGKGAAGDKIYAYWKRGFDRFTEVERYNLYARALGRPGGEVSSGAPNREFNDLWLRFASSVSEWRRQVAVDRLLRDEVPNVVSDQQLRKSARDLAANLSLYGYGIAYFVAVELQQQIRDIIGILSDQEVMAAYGARDLWQVIDQVATLELGGARNSVRYRTMANSGAIIIRWLANNSRRLSRVGYERLLSEQDLVDPGREGREPLDEPANFDLIEACEQYLAVTGTPDDRVEEFSQPTLGPDLTSRPVQIPSFARDVLGSVGVDGVGLSHN